MTKVIYLHNPKTAGTTFKNVLVKTYGKNSCLLFDEGTFDFDDWVNLSHDEKKGYDVLMGHNIYLNLLSEFESVPHFKLSFIRNPVDRVISQYNEIKKPYHPLSSFVKGNKISLEDFINYDKFNIYVENWQANFFAGRNVNGLSENELLERAKEFTSTPNCLIGITELFDESLVYFKEKLDWTIIPTYRKRNVSVSEVNIDSTIINQIKDKNQIDLELYDWAIRRFWDQAKNIPDFESELEKLKLANMALPKHQPSQVKALLSRFKNKLKSLLVTRR